MRRLARMVRNQLASLAGRIGNHKLYFTTGLTLRERLIKWVVKISILNQSVLRSYDKNNIIGMVVSHIDDLLYTGSARYHH